jgi:hypothetical protein
MPIMIRSNKKATKVAFNILGVPANLRKVRMSERERDINKRLNFEETRLTR